MDKKILRFLFRIMIVFFIVIFFMGFFSEVLKPLLLPNVNVAAIGNAGINRRVKQTGRIEPLRSESFKCLEPVEVLEVGVKNGARVAAGDRLFRVRLRADAGGAESYQTLERAFQQLKAQSEQLIYEIDHAADPASEAWSQMMELEGERSLMASMRDLGLLSEQEWQAWNEELEVLHVLWNQAATDRDNAVRWKAEERALIKDKLENLAEKLEELQSQCVLQMEDGWVTATFDGIVMTTPEEDSFISSLEPIMEIAEVTDYQSVKLVTEISLSDYQWVGDSLLVYIRTPKGLLKTYTENIYQTDYNTVIFESLFNKAYEDEIRLGQTYGTMIERQQRFIGTITIPKILISAPGGFYNRGTGRVKIIRQEHGILGDEFFVDEVPVRMIVVGDERVIALPVGGLFVLNGDDLAPGTKVFINQ